MNYQNIYNQIIHRAQTRQLEGYVEKHHVVPKCLGGNNSKNNIVQLTAREHFICHMLLCEIHPDNSKLKYALFLMSIGKQKTKDKHYKISSRTYERLKLEHSLMLTGVKRSIEVINKLKQPKSEETKQKMRKPKPKGFGDAVRERLKNKPNFKLRGRKASNEIKQKQSEALQGRKITWNLKGIKKQTHHRKSDIPVNQYDLHMNLITSFDNIKEASNNSKALAEGIRLCVWGKRLTAGGYIWKRK